jgi:hypothetical protein
LKTQPQFLNDWKAKLWSRFFCLSVYVTMYLNDNQRSAFYESLGLNTQQFNQHVIIETNKTTARIFPEVPDCETEVRCSTPACYRVFLLPAQHASLPQTVENNS